MDTRSISTWSAAGLTPVQEAAPKVGQTATCCEGHPAARWLEVNSRVQTVDTEIWEHGVMKWQPGVQRFREHVEHVKGQQGSNEGTDHLTWAFTDDHSPVQFRFIWFTLVWRGIWQQRCTTVHGSNLNTKKRKQLLWLFLLSYSASRRIACISWSFFFFPFPVCSSLIPQLLALFTVTLVMFKVFLNFPCVDLNMLEQHQRVKTLSDKLV